MLGGGREEVERRRIQLILVVVGCDGCDVHVRTCSNAIVKNHCSYNHWPWSSFSSFCLVDDRVKRVPLFRTWVSHLGVAPEAPRRKTDIIIFFDKFD
jgi:hypothetical protein